MNLFAEVEGRTGKYLPGVHDERTDLTQLRSIFFTRPSLSFPFTLFSIRGSWRCPTFPGSTHPMAYGPHTGIFCRMILSKDLYWVIR